MDRRQKKTRTAIFEAFIQLLSEGDYAQITVGQIIDRADVGRATFYAHFETKDFLLRELCRELFDHVFRPEGASELFCCDGAEAGFVHMFRHLKQNDNNILRLLRSRNNELFLRYFQEQLTQALRTQLALFDHRRDSRLPEDFWLGQICATFIQTVRWWVEGGMVQSPEQITQYFMLAV
jgi:AcrR family transcriptional regulator